MRIELDENWMFESDSLNITLLKSRISKKGVNKGKIAWRPVGHYNNYAEAALAMVDLDIQQCESFAFMLDRLDELKQYITAVVPKIPIPSGNIEDFYKKCRKEVAK